MLDHSLLPPSSSLRYHPTEAPLEGLRHVGCSCIAVSGATPSDQAPHGTRLLMSRMHVTRPHAQVVAGSRWWLQHPLLTLLASSILGVPDLITRALDLVPWAGVATSTITAFMGVVIHLGVPDLVVMAADPATRALSGLDSHHRRSQGYGGRRQAKEKWEAPPSTIALCLPSRPWSVALHHAAPAEPHATNAPPTRGRVPALPSWQVAQPAPVVVWLEKGRRVGLVARVRWPPESPAWGRHRAHMGGRAILF